MQNLLLLYGLDSLSKDSHLLFESGYFGPGNATHVFDALKVQVAKVREQAIPLVESFGAVNGRLMSTIGNSYGDIYELQLETAKKSKLNTGKNPKGFESF